jgi:ribonuclease D
LAETHDLPSENLISPQLVRNLAWEPPADVSAETVSQALRRQGARQWQVDLVLDGLVEALAV